MTTLRNASIIACGLLYIVHCADSGIITSEKTKKSVKDPAGGSVNGTTPKLRSRAQLEEALEKISADGVPAGSSPDRRPQANGTARYRLYYFDFPGRAEPIRLLFHYVGESFEDFRIPSDKWIHQYKQNTPYGHVPVLIDRTAPVGDRTLAESYAILRFLARQYGLSGVRQRANRVEEAVEEMPEDDSDAASDVTPSTDAAAELAAAWTEARVDEFADFHRDVTDDFHGLFSETPKPRTSEQITQAAALADANFHVYERQLAEQHGGGFFFGSAPSWPDFIVADFFEKVYDTFPRVFDAWPSLDAYRKRFRQLPALHDYFVFQKIKNN